MASKDGVSLTQDGATCPAPEAVSLCANGCGFFGSAATMNLCSLCYRKVCLREIEPPAAELVVEAPLAVVESVPLDATPAAVDMNRCGACGRRVKLAGFACRCGGMFCGSHRYPEEHGCEFDYKAGGRAAISASNPVVKGEKMDDRI